MTKMDRALVDTLRVKTVAADTAALATNAAEAALPADPSGCGVAYAEYRRQAIYANLFTAAYFALIAMTALVGVVSLALLIWLVVTLQGDTVATSATKLIGTVGTAAGAVITGKAATAVKDASALQSQRATDAAAVATTACGVKIGG